MNYFDDYLSRDFEFENEIKLIFDKNDPLIILDIGACEGEETIKFSNKYPNSKILTFEPVPANSNIIKKNLKKYGVNNAELFELALSDSDGKADLFLSSGNPDTRKKDDWDYGNKSSSLFEPGETKKIHPWLKFENKIEVTTATLNTILKGKEIKWVDFIYMDVQGAELKVLKGLKSYLYRTKAIWLEVEKVELYKDQPLKKDIERFMKGNGFYLAKNTVNNIAGDQLYLNSRLVTKPSLKAALRGHKLNRNNRQPIHGIRNKIFKKTLGGVTPVYLVENRINMYASNGMLWAYDSENYYEKNVINWFENILSVQNNPVVYDVGANNGFYSILSALLNADVYAFEPTKSSFKILKRNLKIYEKFSDNKLVPIPLALADKNEKQTINIYSSSGNNSIAMRSIPKGHELQYIGKQSIETARMDYLIAQKKATPPTLIKIDVEGNELFVLKGAKNTIKKYMPSIIVEYSKETSLDAGYPREEIYNYLNKHNYKIFGLSEVASNLSLISNPNKTKVSIDNLVALNPGDYNNVKKYL